MIRRFARPYARAMMDLVAEPREGKELHGQLARFEDARRGSAELRELFENPGVDTDAKLRVGDMLNAKLGIAIAEVRTAHAVDEEERSRLRAALEARLGRKVELELETDPSLLGGFVAQVESEVWDASVRGRLAKLKSTLV